MPTRATAAVCLEVHDLAVAKLAAGREKDDAFVAGLLLHHLANPTIIESRLHQSPLTGERLELALARIKRLAVG